MKKKKFYRQNKYKYYSNSYIKHLEDQKILTNDLKNLIRRLTLEDLIVIKLELSNEIMKGRNYNLPLWSSMPSIVQESLLRYSLSFAAYSREVYSFLGMRKNSYWDAMRKYGLFRRDDESGI
jgi:hypothetical protein